MNLRVCWWPVPHPPITKHPQERIMLRSLPMHRGAANRIAGLGLLLGMALLPLAGLSQSCFAQDYPARPIHLIVPFPPGGVADIIARPLAERLSASLGEPVVVENRGGATGTLGASYVAHADP